MWIANAGDSRAVLARKVPSPTGPQAGDKKTAALQAIPLTQDHNPDKDSEKLRIEASGGFVSPPPEPGLSARVWLDADMTQVGLAMARSIGDHVVKEAGVIAEPEIFERDIEPEDKFVVMASDGIWEFLPNEKVVKIINRELKKEGDRSAMTACESLITSAAKRWQQEEGGYRDDITAVLLRLPCFS
jgi:protein phosphatase 2C family protein 2/3